MMPLPTKPTSGPTPPPLPTSGPTPPPLPTSGPTHPPGRITLWRSETGTEWAALLRWGTFQTVMVRDTREQALADMTAWWRQHTAEGKAACRDNSPDTV